MQCNAIQYNLCSPKYACIYGYVGYQLTSCTSQKRKSYCFHLQQIVPKFSCHRKLIFRHSYALFFLIWSAWVCVWLGWTELGSEGKAGVRGYLRFLVFKSGVGVYSLHTTNSCSLLFCSAKRHKSTTVIIYYDLKQSTLLGSLFIGHCVLTPSQPCRLYRGKTQHYAANHMSKSFVSYRHFAKFVWRGFRENEVEWTGKEEMRRRQTLAVDKACYARLYIYSYSRLWKREPL